MGLQYCAWKLSEGLLKYETIPSETEYWWNALVILLLLLLLPLLLLLLLEDEEYEDPCPRGIPPPSGWKLKSHLLERGGEKLVRQWESFGSRDHSPLPPTRPLDDSSGLAATQQREPVLSIVGVPPFLLVTAVMFPICFLTGVAKDTEPSRGGEREKGRRSYLGFEGDLVTSKHHSFLSSKPSLLVIDGYEYF